MNCRSKRPDAPGSKIVRLAKADIDPGRGVSHIPPMKSEHQVQAAAAANLDEAVGFTLPHRHARGRVVRLGPVLDEILSAHDYPAPIARILSEALVMTALIGSTLKDVGGQLTLQAQTESGIIDLLVCDYRGGELRGYIRFDKDRLGEVPHLPSLYALFGKGYLAITFDQAATGERYQGIVPLEGTSLADAAQSFFSQSEQIPSFVRLAVDDTGHVAGGLLVQHLPEGEEGRERLHTRLDHPEWEHVRILSETLKASELTADALPLSDLLWRLFHEEDEIRVLATVPLSKGCRCNLDHIRGVISRFGADERRDMVGKDGFIRVDCEFCSRSFPIAPSDLDD
jgi:molecular chaperone Hsp33